MPPQRTQNPTKKDLVKRLTSIREKLSSLRQEEDKINQTLRHEYAQDLSKYLIVANAIETDFNVLLGGMLEVITRAQKDPQRAEVWQKSGLMFRRSRRQILPQSRQKHQELGNKQTVKRIQIHRKEFTGCQPNHRYQLLKKKQHKVRVNINNLLASQAQEITKMQTQTNNKRRARVRTLIQLGSLVNLVGLCAICQIKEGDDLQYDISSRDKAAVLVGILLDAVGTISDPPDSQQIEAWRETGIRFLKQRSAQVYYQKKRVDHVGEFVKMNEVF